ncbi:hypothetical protein CI109_101631 [Kwoniella shandongensis]|uniref:DUF7729 domain-containing protein n=1 Tax=Kwoniella shandongensis TaxID=1734106 RepID=A0A5M6C6J5_9TREE|nr:uncharacterized protein CI109_001244 [Kwoniella shandongensis]KAA5530441.1 hypothetical protein CI109_001244 [Kwoniella shandongensis]
MRLGLITVLASVLSFGVCEAHGHGLRDRHRRGGALSRRDNGSLVPLPPEPTHTQTTVLANLTEMETSDIPSIVVQPRARVSNSTAATATLPLVPSTIPLRPPSPVPTPLDLSLSRALSTQCMNYLASLLSSTTFLSCLPFSLLLTTSTAYSTIVSTALTTGNYTTLNQLIAYTSTPQPGSEQCTTYMQGVLSTLSGKSNCGNDLSNGVLVAKEAKIGIGNYEVMRVAEGLKNEDQGVYCYLQALREERPDDLYLWQLPCGISLPPSSTPTCSKCSAALLNTYTSYTSTTPSLNATIIDAAVRRVNDVCGPTFVNFSSKSGAAISSKRYSVPTLMAGLGIVGLIWTFGLL